MFAIIGKGLLLEPALSLEKPMSLEKPQELGVLFRITGEVTSGIRF